MADIKDRRPGGGGASGEVVRYHDEGDGTWSEAHAAHLRGWDTTDLVWVRLPIDHATGKLQVDASVSTSGETRPSTAAVTSVNDTAVSTTLLAANVNRLGAAIFNDSTVALFVKFGTTASATSFTVKIDPQGYYEVAFPVYSGRIDGIWASDASGAARITELSA